MTPFAIAGMQLHLSGQGSNLGHITNRIEMLLYLYPWVQMVVCSELATFGGWTGNAQPLPSEAETQFAELAARHNVWLLPGSFFEKTDSGIFNTAPVIDPDGNIIARYRKMFPFLPYETGVESGTEFCVFDVPNVGRFGVSICYDMWFPETSRTLAAMGAEVILHPTLTGSIDRDVELAIARATAATNQCFVVDINGVGDGGNGKSIIVAPSGDVLYEAGSAEEMIPIEIDLDRVSRSREVGLRGLGQPLKSFRDRKVDFNIYHRSKENHRYLDTLGPLVKQARGSRAGLDDPAPEAEAVVIPPAPPVDAPAAEPGPAPTGGVS
ncbi:MAG: carbon-nitrogen hydrolase family protein [Phycisphaeraceae bacterium]|nr:carbon-nitrogen hydrolase family protein [Phycisphaeraceae bacterium]MCB9848383.1 carbon-nitrogen hydrolase family protein [Phycisphaeraceae bacterium]